MSRFNKNFAKARMKAKRFHNREERRKFKKDWNFVPKMGTFDMF